MLRLANEARHFHSARQTRAPKCSLRSAIINSSGLMYYGFLMITVRIVGTYRHKSEKGVVCDIFCLLVHGGAEFESSHQFFQTFFCFASHLLPRNSGQHSQRNGSGFIGTTLPLLLAVLLNIKHRIIKVS